VLSFVKEYPVEYGAAEDGVMLKLTHGTGDDNVHFQNTLQLVDALEKAGKRFELMIYPDGMHGYRGAQAKHSTEADHAFWLKYLKR
jgi:dipeptidyl-peptidase-4